MIQRMIIGVVLLFGILLLTLPKRDEASIRKLASASMLVCSKEFRADVAMLVLRDEAVTLVFDPTRCPDLISSLQVEEDGFITARSAKHGLTMELSPVIEGDQVRWSCSGQPAEMITGLCKALEPVAIETGEESNN